VADVRLVGPFAHFLPVAEMNDSNSPIAAVPAWKNPRLVLALVGLAIFVALIMLAPWRAAEQTTTELDLSGPRLPLPEPPSSGYVGSTACRDCHEDIVDTFRRHPMGNSMTPVAKATLIEDYLEDNKFESGGYQYQVSSTAGPMGRAEGFRHEESLRDQQGDLVLTQGVDIDYVVGSGSRGRSYLFQRGSLLYQSPLTWYVEKGLWDLSPGYRPANHIRFERRVDDDCLSCHTGRVKTVPRRRDHYDPAEPFHEVSIGCERCHGPGRKHVEMQLSGMAGEDSLIVNPAKLEPRKRESVCNQCHLAGRWRQPRFGKSFLDFRPGQELDDAWTVMVSGTGVDAQGQIKFTSHVEQMHSSQCFQASKGQLGCISCHDPHKKPAAQQAEAFYRSRCLNCHQQQDCSEDEPLRMAQNDSCISCHMSKTNVSDIAHSSATDHRILRTFSAPTKATTVEPQWEYFDNADERIPAWERDRIDGITLYVQFTKTNNRQYLEQAKKKLLATTRIAANDVETLLYLGEIYLLENDFDSASRCLATLLEINPSYELALLSMATLQYRQNNLVEANQYFQQLFELNPWSSSQYGFYAQSLVQAGDINGAIAALEHAIGSNPTSQPLHLFLARLLESAGRPDEANEHRRLVDQLEELTRPEPAGGMSPQATEGS
jgi:tetratricopeptide (TPR) repeat protein